MMKISLSLLQKKVTNLTKGKFVDWKKLYVKAGNGGNGAVSFVHSRDHKGGPNGGDGGNGGSIRLLANQNFTHLNHLNYSYVAKNGTSGTGRNRHGKNADDIFLKIPVGTVVKNFDTKVVLADITENGEIYTVVHGGKRGFGNVHFKSPVNVRPPQFTKGGNGESLCVEMELKLIADVALVGFPNAGKSSLLSSVSRSEPKIGNYPFTTLKPNIGVMRLSEDVSITVADVPGLIEGAHMNIGLGHSFLRHVERCKAFVYVIDGSQPDALQHFHVVQREMEFYQVGMTERPSMLVANKCDLVKDHDNLINNIQGNVPFPVVVLSAKHQQNINELRLLLLKMFGRRQLIENSSKSTSVTY